MRLIDDIISRLPLSKDLVFCGVKYIILDGVCGYFDNIEGIAHFSNSCIELNIKKAYLKVSGNNLSILKYSGNDLIIGGVICSVEKHFGF